MAKLLGVDVAKLVDANLSKKLYKGTFTKVTPGTRDPANPGKGTNPTTADYAFRGFAANYSTFLVAQDLVRQNEFQIIIVAKSLKLPAGVVPAPSDRIVLTGDPELGSKTLVITERGVQRDPATATWTCNVKG